MNKITFTLNPDNRNSSDEELLNDLVKVAEKLNAVSVSKREYNKLGRYSSSTIVKRFGSWNGSLEKAGLTVKRKVNIPDNELIDDLKKVAEKIKPKRPTQRIYDNLGKFTSVTIHERIGWNEALKKINIKPVVRFDITEEELFNNLKDVWLRIGKAPGKRDMIKPISKYSETPYINKFGSWRLALEAFVDYVNSDDENDNAAEEQEKVETEKDGCIIPKHKTKRDINWRLRFKVFQRDHFRCRACGKSPAKDIDVELHVDHIIPWAKGGETVIENLQTLCSVCNIGKSDYTE